MSASKHFHLNYSHIAGMVPAERFIGPLGFFQFNLRSDLKSILFDAVWFLLSGIQYWFIVPNQLVVDFLAKGFAKISVNCFNSLGALHQGTNI